MTVRLVVLASGGGTNLQAVLDATSQGRLDAEVVAVVSDREDAFALERARSAGVPAEPVPVGGRSRAVYEGVLAHIVEKYVPDLVVLAGWMRLLGVPFLSRFPVINIHPALPGAFPGLRAIERAFDAWQRGEIDHSGVMVHWVPDAGVDDGPVIEAEPVMFEPSDTLASFEARIHECEHRLLVTAIQQAFDASPSDALSIDTESQPSGVST